MMTNLEFWLGFGFVSSTTLAITMTRAWWREARRADGLNKDNESSDKVVNDWAKVAGDAREALQDVETRLAATRRKLEPDVPSAGGR